MSRYRGPRLKKCRALGTELPGLTRKSIERRPYPPGITGANRLRSKKSVYGTQLSEKQKLRFNYVIDEKYLRIMFRKALRSKQQTALKLIQFLEMRLDNAVFRAGFAPTIPAARQLVAHKHICINGKRVRTASQQVKAGDVITLSDKGGQMQVIKDCWDHPAIYRPSWLQCDEKSLSAKVVGEPSQDEIGFPVNLGYVVEFYSRSVS